MADEMRAAITALQERRENAKAAVIAALRTQSPANVVASYRSSYERLRQLAEEAMPYRVMVEAVEELWREKLDKQGGTHLPVGDDGIDVHYELGDADYDRNEPLLLSLLREWANSNNLPESVWFPSCVYYSKPKEPELKCDIRALNRLAKTYGEPVQKIIDRCITRREPKRRFVVDIRQESGGKP